MSDQSTSHSLEVLLMKRHILTDVGLLFLIPLGIVGFSLSSDNQSESKQAAQAQNNTVKTTTDTKYGSGSVLSANQVQSLDFRPSRVYRVRYTKVNFKTVLDDDYREEKLYRYVPGAKKNNRTYKWGRIKARIGKKVYVDMKAKAYYRDDDGEREAEDFYRIRTAKSASSQKYWVNEDAIEDD